MKNKKYFLKKHKAGILFMFWKNRLNLSELLKIVKGKTFVAMIMKKSYWHKPPVLF